MQTKNFDPFDFSKKVVGGVPVYFKNVPMAPCIHIDIIFKTGGFSDPEGKEGLSHFLEHMIFDGSSKFKDKKAVTEWSKKYAIHSWNAWTSSYETSYNLKCLPENFKTVVIGMKDMIFSPLLRKEDIEHERGVITQESWRRYKNEKYLAYTKKIFEIMHHGHNLSRISAPLGWPDTIAKISQADVRQWHEDKYVKNNMFIVLVGAVSEASLKHLEKFIKGLPEKPVHAYEKGEIHLPKENKEVFSSEDIGDPQEQVEITISSFKEPIPAEKAQIASFFRYMLADLLFEKLRNEKGLCYSVGVNSWLMSDYSLFFMNIMTDEKNIELVQKEFWKIHKDIVNGKYKGKFSDYRRVLLQDMKSKERSSSHIARDAIQDLSRYGEIMPLHLELRRMQRVSYADVAKFAKEIYGKKETFTEIILPAKSQKAGNPKLLD